MSDFNLDGVCMNGVGGAGAGEKVFEEFKAADA